ncbi:MAG TPA: hypothetical protein VKT32_16400 [Chthonomonadaceae bacterium]|nr:hypothetical protein [Chthonomonadaceae bacterium]
MMLPWKKEQAQAEMRARWMWIIGGTLTVGIAVAAFAAWRMRIAQAMSGGGMDMMENEAVPEFVDTAMGLPADSAIMSSEEAVMPPAGKKRSGRRKITNTMPVESTQPQDMSKMVSGGQALRDHDFPTPVSSHRSAEEAPVTLDQDTLPPEVIQSGGAIGELPGDLQPVGEATSIMDQGELTPDFAQEEG